MTKYRTRAFSTEPRITAEAVAAFRAGDGLALNRLLGIRIWQCGPLEAGDKPLSWGSDGGESWQRARELRRQLEAAQ